MNSRESKNNDMHINHVEDFTNQSSSSNSSDTSLASLSSPMKEEEDKKKSLQQQQDSFEEKTSMAAWIETLVCVGLNSSCAMMWMTASSTPVVMSAWMDCTLTQLNWLSNAAAICNTIFSLLTAWSYEKIGIKMSIILCGVINTAGCWIRCIAILVPSEKRFPIVMLGQIIASIGGPLVYK
jgi:FLVCR family MFS transporter 7